MVIVGCVVTFAVCLLAMAAFFMANTEKLERKQRELEEAKEHEQQSKQQAAEAVGEMAATTQAAHTGDSKHDFDYMANQLHQYAQRK